MSLLKGLISGQLICMIREDHKINCQLMSPLSKDKTVDLGSCSHPHVISHFPIIHLYQSTSAEEKVADELFDKSNLCFVIICVRLVDTTYIVECFDGILKKINHAYSQL